MVRLKGWRAQALDEEINGFNSIVVRLKDGRISDPRMAIPMFQFHSGSIKRDISADTSVAADLFQFHSGSIKRWPGSPRLCRPRYSFNSIVVRLKAVATWSVAHGGFLCFNSIVVRLKEAKADLAATEGLCFNSIVVRLKVPQWWFGRPRLAGFNSIVVRLKVEVQHLKQSTKR